MKQRFRLVHDQARYNAKRAIDEAGDGWIVTVAEPTRSSAQNDRMWAMLTDVSRCCPEGRKMTPERWKAVFMQSFGHQVQFETDLEGRPFPIGHKSSALTVREMGDLMEFISAYGSQNGVVWSEPPPLQVAV